MSSPRALAHGTLGLSFIINLTERTSVPIVAVSRIYVYNHYKFMENKPTYFAYAVTEREDNGGAENRDFWTKIGAAWRHKDGKGFTVSLEAMPLNARLLLRQPEEQEEKKPEAERVPYEEEDR